MQRAVVRFLEIAMTWMDLIGLAAVIAPAAVCLGLALLGALDEGRS